MATSSKTAGKTAASKSKAAPPKKAPAAAPAKAKKVEPKAAPARKAAPAKKAASPAAKKGNGAMAAPCSDDQRRHYIEVAAYYIAERRGFPGGNELEDWAQATIEVDRMLKEGKLSVD